MADRRVGVQITAEGSDLDKRLDGARRAMDRFIKVTDRADKATKGLESSQARTAQSAVKTAQAAKRVTAEEQKRAQAHRRAARTSRDAAAGSDALRRSVTRAIPKLASYSSTLRRVSSLGTALATALGVRLVAQVAALEVALNLQAAAAGVTSLAFRDLNTLYNALGATGQDVTNDIYRIANALEEARRGSVRYQEAFDALNIAFKTAEGGARDAATVLYELGQTAGSLEEFSTEAQAAFRTLLGRGGARFVGIFRRPREEIEKIQQTLGKADAAGEKYRQQWFNINFAVNQVKDSIAGLFLTAVGENADRLFTIMGAFQALAETWIPRLVGALTFAAENARILVQVLLTLAGYAVLTAMSTLIGAIGNVIRQLITMIKTARLATAALIRSGIGILAAGAAWLAADYIFKNTNSDLELIEESLKNNRVAFENLGDGAEEAAQQINPFFKQWQDAIRRTQEEIVFLNSVVGQRPPVGGLSTLELMVIQSERLAGLRERLRQQADEIRGRLGFVTQAEVDRITQMNQVMTTLGNSVSNTFASWATGATKARDAMRQLLAQIAQFFIRRQVFALLERFGLIRDVPSIPQLPIGGIGGGATAGAQGLSVPAASQPSAARLGAGGVAGYAGPSTVVVQGVRDPHVVASQVASALQPLWRRDIATARGR